MIFLRSLTARPRLLVSAIVAVAVFPVLPAGERLATRLLLAWDAGVVLNLLLTWTMMARSGVNDLRQRAGDIEDAGAATILALTITAAVASLGAIAAELRGLHSGTGEGPALRIALAGATTCSHGFLCRPRSRCTSPEPATRGSRSAWRW